MSTSTVGVVGLRYPMGSLDQMVRGWLSASCVGVHFGEACFPAVFRRNSEHSTATCIQQDDIGCLFPQLLSVVHLARRSRTHLQQHV